jgi:nitrite reductase/ring-hydroxylating ferredoxin subunit
MTQPTRLVKVADFEDLVPGRGTLVEVEGLEVGLFRVGDRCYALENTCPHRDGYLHDGAVEGKTVTCPWHFAVFDLETGAVLEGPAARGVRPYDVVLEEGAVKIALPAGAGPRAESGSPF